MILSEQWTPFFTLLRQQHEEQIRCSSVQIFVFGEREKTVQNLNFHAWNLWNKGPIYVVLCSQRPDKSDFLSFLEWYFHLSAVFVLFSGHVSVISLIFIAFPQHHLTDIKKRFKFPEPFQLFLHRLTTFWTFFERFET